MGSRKAAKNCPKTFASLPLCVRPSFLSQKSRELLWQIVAFDAAERGIVIARPMKVEGCAALRTQVVLGYDGTTAARC
jgi:hypothetical protein